VVFGAYFPKGSAVKGTPVISWKDINQAALDLGLKEAPRFFGKGIERGKVDVKNYASTLNVIVPTLEYSAIKDRPI